MVASAFKMESVVDIMVAKKAIQKRVFEKSLAHILRTKTPTFIFSLPFKAPGMKALKPTTNMKAFKMRNPTPKEKNA